jgi:hypothetical protein
MTARVNLVINQGATFYQEVKLYDDNDDVLIVNESNGNPIYTVLSMMRKSYQSSNSVTFDTALANGMLILSLTADATTKIVPGRYVYDAKLSDSNTATRIIEGIVTVRPEATL